MPTAFDHIANAIVQAVPRGRTLVAIDGVDGSGKTSFTSTLAMHFGERSVVVVHADDFLNPSRIRSARGQHSPEAHWLDLYDYGALISRAVHPLTAAGDGWYRPASYDLASDTALDPEPLYAPNDAIVLIEGLFLHRDQLVDFWDVSEFLDVPFSESALRMSRRDGTDPNPEHDSMHKYVGGQQLYFEHASPRHRATFVVDNADYTNPRLIET